MEKTENAMSNGNATKKQIRKKKVNKKERNVMASENYFVLTPRCNRTFDWLMRRKDYGTL